MESGLESKGDMAIKPYFTSENLEELSRSFNQIDSDRDDILLKFAQHKFSNEAAYEYAAQGLLRRISILHRCIKNIFLITPPANMLPLTKDASADLSINLQSFILNVFGAIDNKIGRASCRERV